MTCRTKAEFKLALRRCRAAEEQLLADNNASQLASEQHPRAFLNGISRHSCSKATSYSNKVGNAVGCHKVCEMRKNRFNTLNYDGRSMREFCNKLHFSVNNNYHHIITAKEVSAVIACQKKNKSAGLNGIYMESFMCAGDKLNVHLSLLFTYCIRHCYLSRAFMDSVILPQVKNECGDLTDVNNYYKNNNY